MAGVRELDNIIPEKAAELFRECCFLFPVNFLEIYVNVQEQC
jgi:hypothetical protein